jgi:hypothetical protein
VGVGLDPARDDDLARGVDDVCVGRIHRSRFGDKGDRLAGDADVEHGGAPGRDDEPAREDEVDHACTGSLNRGRTRLAHFVIRSRCSGSSASIAPSKLRAPAWIAART